jgi:Tfp pilus assembly protein PilO
MNAKLSDELEQLRARFVDFESNSSELSVLREERDVIRTRVAEMLEQLEGI